MTHTPRFHARHRRRRLHRLQLPSHRSGGRPRASARQPRRTDLRRSPGESTAGRRRPSPTDTPSSRATSATPRLVRASSRITISTRWSTSPPRATSIVPSTAPSTSSTPTSAAPPISSRPPARTGGERARCSFPPRLHRRGLRFARRRRVLHRGHTLRSRRAPTRPPRRRPITWCAPGTGPTGCRSPSPTARTTTGRISSPRS